MKRTVESVEAMRALGAEIAERATPGTCASR